MSTLALLLTACGIPDVVQQVPPEAAAEVPEALSAPPSSATLRQIRSAA